MYNNLDNILTEGSSLPDKDRAAFFSKHTPLLKRILNLKKDSIVLLYFIKPDALDKENEIIEKTIELGQGTVEVLENSRLEIIGKENKMKYQGREYQADIHNMLTRHYTPTIGGKPFFDDYINQMKKRIVSYILTIPNVPESEHSKAIYTFRTDIIGSTDCTNAETIRGMFGKNIKQNGVHCSDKSSEATREISNFYCEILKQDFNQKLLSK